MHKGGIQHRAEIILHGEWHALALSGQFGPLADHQRSSDRHVIGDPAFRI